MPVVVSNNSEESNSNTQGSISMDLVVAELQQSNEYLKTTK